MTTALYLLLVTGMLGAFDVIFFHIHTCRLYKLPSARRENVTHAVRALLYAALIVATAYLDASGLWVSLYLVLCASECINNVFDTVLEHKSRAPQGGLPPGEYVVHVALSVLTGAALACMLLDAIPRLSDETQLSWRSPSLPAAVVPMVNTSIAVSLLFFGFELLQVFKLGTREGTRLPKTSTEERAEPA